MLYDKKGKLLMGENITLTEPAARIALFIGKSKYLLLLFKMRQIV
ncbi:hypothetical protein PI172_2120 [Prevotella intermedia]|uniref:Uncharacterized protein n=1 Tax=Prevotella intermedia TaxID=28131 RepID=A0AAD1BKB6_PREIN|nr:hypothetical protein PI172_2120 [Prevotella intermedia]